MAVVIDRFSDKTLDFFFHVPACTYFVQTPHFTFAESSRVRTNSAEASTQWVRSKTGPFSARSTLRGESISKDRGSLPAAACSCCGWQTVGGALDQNRFAASRTNETDVLWCRFRGQKGNCGSELLRMNNPANTVAFHLTFACGCANPRPCLTRVTHDRSQL